MLQLNPSSTVQTEQLKSCPNCHSRNLKVWCQSPERSLKLSQQIFTYSQCQDCRSIFLSERPLETEIHKFYPEHYQPYQSNSIKSHSLNKIKAILAQPLFSTLEKIYTPNQVNNYILDFGCGSEKFLNYARSLGWQTIGLDFSKNVIQAIQKNGHQGFFMTPDVWDKIQNESLHFVRISHVLEHLYNPLETLSNLYSKMAKGSTLHIIMPNAYGISARIFRSYWWGLECPRHLMFYSPQVLKQKLHQLGFENINIFYENITKDMARSMGYVMYEKNLIKHEIISDLASNSLLKILLFLPCCLAYVFQLSDRFQLIAKKG